MSADFQSQAATLHSQELAVKSSVLDKALISAAMAGSAGFIGYEWSIGNEIATPALAGRIAEVAPGLGGTVLTALGTAAFVFSEQLASGSLTAIAVNKAPRFTNWLNKKLIDQKTEPRSWEDLSRKDRFDYTMALGASYASLREKTVLPESTAINGIKQAANSAKICAFTVGSIAFAFDGATRFAASGNNTGFLEHVADGAEVVRDVIYDWRVWGLVFGAKFGYRAIKNFVNKHRNNNLAE